MRRRRALFLNLILAAFCLAILFLWPLIRGPVILDRGSSEELSQLLATHTEAEEPFFTELSFSGEKLPYDKNTSTFYLPLNMETESWETGELASAAPDASIRNTPTNRRSSTILTTQAMDTNRKGEREFPIPRNIPLIAL